MLRLRLDEASENKSTAIAKLSHSEGFMLEYSPARAVSQTAELHEKSEISGG